MNTISSILWRRIVTNTDKTPLLCSRPHLAHLSYCQSREFLLYSQFRKDYKNKVKDIKIWACFFCFSIQFDTSFQQHTYQLSSAILPSLVAQAHKRQSPAAQIVWACILFSVYSLQGFTPLILQWKWLEGKWTHPVYLLSQGKQKVTLDSLVTAVPSWILFTHSLLFVVLVDLPPPEISSCIFPYNKNSRLCFPLHICLSKL